MIRAFYFLLGTAYNRGTKYNRGYKEFEQDTGTAGNVRISFPKTPLSSTCYNQYPDGHRRAAN